MVETFPAVLIAYRLMFWTELMEKVKEEEAVLLKVCSMDEVTNDVRGRLFELIVIVKCQAQTILCAADNGDGVGEDVLPMTLDTGVLFQGQTLPSPSNMDNNSLFIPVNSNFPAIALIWKAGKNVWGIQVHVANHDDCLPTFRDMCKESGWDETFDNIFMVYLSPDLKATQLLTCLASERSRDDWRKLK
jgi:hypothetical protein